MSEVHTFWVERGMYAPGTGAKNTPNVEAISCNEIDETTNCLLTRRLLGLIVSVTRCRIVHVAAIAPVVITSIPTALVRASRSSPTKERVACRNLSATTRPETLCDDAGRPGCSVAAEIAVAESGFALSRK